MCRVKNWNEVCAYKDREWQIHAYLLLTGKVAIFIEAKIQWLKVKGMVAWGEFVFSAAQSLEWHKSRAVMYSVEWREEE